MADVAKVNCFTTFGEEEETIEFLEEDRAWLMDGGEDGLARVGKLA